ncbi:LysR family transcriptional regulator [Acidovorax sp. SUPP3434]|uniref:LysR family transcriptional regulator n=1 Tax=Acidovorax sp. SUPP3434 TaxID=2920880 RepID=UPI0023DE3E73|nr:LysR family transcriptional regulator [Acidovorax sp. SUPP3434]GKT01671.1 LysR family transcriptional regulator [Acidovorax sp. SUPP3434]
MKFENISDLRVLVETARGGSLTAAARVLEITPAAASAMLKRLEAQVGARLFERSTRAMRLTDQGQTLLDYAARALELLEEGASQAASEAGALRGTVRVAAPSDLSRSLLLQWFDGFLQQHPGVHLALSVSDRVQDVRRDAVDVALRYGALADSQLIARPLCITRRVACAAPAYLARRGVPRHPADLAGHDCLTLHIAGRREVRWHFERAADGEAVSVTVEGERSVDDGSIAHEWALAGGGIVYKSAIDVRASLLSGALVALLPDWRGQRYALHAVLPSHRFVPARVRALVDHVAQCCAALVAEEAAMPGHPGWVALP